MDFTTRQECIDFITKMQDKEKTSIGLYKTGLLTMLGTIVTSGLYIYKELPGIIYNDQIGLVIYTFVVFVNLFYCVCMLSNSLFRQKKVQQAASLNLGEIDLRSSFLRIIDLSIFICAACVNLYIIRNFNLPHQWIFYLFFILNLIAVINIITLVIIQHMNPTIITKNHNKNIKTRTFVFSILMISFLLVVSIFSLMKFIRSSILYNNLEVSLVGLHMFFVLVFLQLCLGYFLKKIRLSWLLNLEKEVYLEDNFSPFEIKEKLKKDYLNSSNIDSYF